MSNPVDPFEFVKNLWGQMAVPGFGLTSGVPGMGGGSAPQMPSFDPKELETRLAQLKQVKQWLEMNLNVMNLQVNTIEMQLAAMSGFKDVSEKMFGDQGSAAKKSAETFGGSGFGGSGSVANPSAGAGPAAPWMDPQAWFSFMQTQAASAQQAAQQGAQKAMNDGVAAMESAARGGSGPAATGAAKPTSKKSPRARKKT